MFIGLFDSKSVKRFRDDIKYLYRYLYQKTYKMKRSVKFLADRWLLGFTNELEFFANYSVEDKVYVHEAWFPIDQLVATLRRLYKKPIQFLIRRVNIAALKICREFGARVTFKEVFAVVVF